ncbi:MAG: hypothetical protein N2C13_00755 [Chloroflexota bacterium]
MRKYIEALMIPSVALSAIGIAILLGVITLTLSWVLSSPPSNVARPTAILTVIPWATSTLKPTNTSTPDPSELASGIPTLLPDEIGIGSIVQIVGTEGTGLNIRSQPGLASAVFFLGYDSEIFEVRDGPMEVDGIVWWYLVTPVDEQRAGWAAFIYLSLVSNP